jgi:toxin ParE1/3/4
MSYSVEISEQANGDLRGIYEYIAFKLQSLQNAVGQLSRLEKNILSLSEMPKRCRRYGEEPWFSRGLRVMPVDHYCVFYIPDDEKKIVSVLRVMYGGRDIGAQLAKHKD